MTSVYANYSSECACCKGHISIGEPIVPTESRNVAVRNSLIYIPKVIEDIIMRFAGAGGRIEDVYWIHQRCGQATVSSSGRKVIAPSCFGDRKFVGGSGFAGCDQYDGNFGGGGCQGDGYEKPVYATKTDKDFVVNDDELTCQHALAEQFEEEWGPVAAETEEEAWNSGAETEEEECSWDCESDVEESVKTVSFAEKLEVVHVVLKLTMLEICGDWGATVRGHETDDLHWETLAGMRIGKERTIFEAWKKTISH